MAEILYVEDVPGCQQAISMALRSSGHAVRVVGNGVSALEALRVARPDLILLDVTMPEMDGLVLLERIRNTAAWRGIPVIVFTASTDARHRERAQALGIQEYFIKSRVSLGELRAAAEASIGRGVTRERMDSRNQALG